MQKNQQGFTLVEIFISLSIGLVLFAGVMSVFVGMKSTTSETSSLGTLQENGRFALNVITDDLMRQNFWGDLASPVNVTNISRSGFPVVPVGGDCIGGGINNASFPQAVGTFRTIWGVTAAVNNPINCINDARIGSDVLQLKRVLAQAFDPLVVNPDNNRFWLNTNAYSGIIFPGDIAAVPPVNNGQMWQYQHHVYYVRDEVQGNISVPVLMQATLSNGANLMTFQPLIDGIERIHFMYGVDTDDDRVVNAYIPAGTMNDGLWDNSNILAVKVYILARDILPDANYTDTKSYLMGNLPVPAANDNFRRLLLMSTVTLYNSGVESWSGV